MTNAEKRKKSGSRTPQAPATEESSAEGDSTGPRENAKGRRERGKDTVTHRSGQRRAAGKAPPKTRRRGTQKDGQDKPKAEQRQTGEGKAETKATEDQKH